MYWWANLLVLLAIAFVVMMLWDLGTGAKFILKKPGEILVVFAGLVLPVFFSVLSIRRVLVYEDRIEVRFPLRRSRNHVIYLKDVDGYGVATRETRKLTNSKKTEEHSYVFLITRGRLLYYISTRHCSNYDEMLDVLNEKFGLKDCCYGEFFLNWGEWQIAEKGLYIPLTGIGEEELAQLRANKHPVDKEWEKKRRMGLTNDQSRSMGLAKIQHWSMDLTDIKQFGLVTLILTICFGLFYGVNMLHKVAKQKATIEIACIDASTKMPKDYYLLVDSIDVDTLGTVCKRRELKEENGVRNKAVDWIFKVKGRKDVWITLCVIMGEHDDIDDSEQRKYCLKTLHSRNLYERAKDDNYKKMRVERLWYAVSVIKYVKHVELLNFDKPILIGSAVYNEETQW